MSFICKLMLITSMLTTTISKKFITTTYMLSHTISKISQLLLNLLVSIGGCISFAHSFGVNPSIQNCEIWPQETIFMWCGAKKM